jgi:hypothetical protein
VAGLSKSRTLRQILRVSEAASIMAHFSCKPTFTVKPVKLAHRWYIEAEWPSGRIEQIKDFASDFEAQDWIVHQSDAWLQQRSG